MINFPLRPGRMVSLSVRCTGGVTNDHEVLSEKVLDDGSLEKKTKNRKRTIHPDEYANATRKRTEIRGEILRVCIKTPFKLLCLESRIPELEEAIERGRTLRNEWNEHYDSLVAIDGKAGDHVRIVFEVLTGKIGASDAETVNAIRGEVAAMLQEMLDATASGDAATIRDACSTASRMSHLIEAESRAHEELSHAVRAGRAFAHRIAIKVEKHGEDLAVAIEESDLEPIAQARNVFLAEYVAPPSDIVPVELDIDQARFQGLAAEA